MFIWCISAHKICINVIQLYSPSYEGSLNYRIRIGKFGDLNSLLWATYIERYRANE
jgi:hypothetical protein